MNLMLVIAIKTSIIQKASFRIILFTIFDALQTTRCTLRPPRYSRPIILSGDACNVTESSKISFRPEDILHF